MDSFRKDLTDFECFAFVMTVLEHHSVHDCAVFLDCSPRQVGLSKQLLVVTAGAK
jgi:hypothetical protein